MKNKPKLTRCIDCGIVIYPDSTSFKDHACFPKIEKTIKIKDLKFYCEYGIQSGHDGVETDTDAYNDIIKRFCS